MVRQLPRRLRNASPVVSASARAGGLSLVSECPAGGRGRARSDPTPRRPGGQGGTLAGNRRRSSTARVGSGTLPNVQYRRRFQMYTEDGHLFRTTLDNPPRFQWEISSGTFDCSQSVNCGPTGSTQQADFYRDREFPIERTRIRADVSRCRPTNAWEQVEMLRKRDVPADVAEIDSLAELDALLGKGKRRPVGIGVLMSRMTAETRGHPFLGWHRITILCKARRRRNGRYVYGYIYTDPNFSPPGGYRPDPRKGHRFIRRGELRYAFIDNSPRYAIVPHNRKAL